jgi:hypothetical protein
VWSVGSTSTPSQDNDGTVVVTVASGYALDPKGDEIVVAEQVSLALPAAGAQWVVAARYEERLVEPLLAASRAWATRASGSGH